MASSTTLRAVPAVTADERPTVHLRVVMEVLGHSQMRTTTDIHSHVMPALGRDAADRMGKALGN